MSFKKQYQTPYEQPPPSPIEVSFWETAKPLIPELQKEVWIDKKYRVDFLIPSKKVIIELYGYQHHNTKEKITKDAERERYLQRLGYQVIRFTGTEVFKDVRKCVNEVLLLTKLPPTGISITNSQVEKSFTTSASAARENQPVNQATNLQRKTTITSGKQIRAKRNHTIFGMKLWQVIVLSIIFMVLMCVFFCFALLIFNSARLP